VGDRTDYNRLRLDIETDGSMSPEETLTRASGILVEQFKVLGEGEESVDSGSEGNEPKEDKSADETKTEIEDLKLSTRTVNALIVGGIKTIAGLVKKNEAALRELEGIGDKGIGEIKKALKKLGLVLAE
jgi:DNA-directed RNA polymerase subunit alpha